MCCKLVKLTVNKLQRDNCSCMQFYNLRLLLLCLLLWERKLLTVLLLLHLRLRRHRRRRRGGSSGRGRVLRPPRRRQVDALPDPVGRLAVVELPVVQPDVLLEAALVVVHLVAEGTAEVAQRVVVLCAVARELDLAVERLAAVLADIFRLFDVRLQEGNHK